MKHSTTALAAASFLVVILSSCSPPSAQKLLNKGDFLGAEHALTPTTRDGAYILSLCETALGNKPDFQTLSSLPPEKREYIVSLLALFSPQVTLDYLHTRPTLSAKEAQAAVVALRVQNQEDATISRQEESWIYPPSAYEKSIQDTHLPDPKEPTPQLREEVKVLVTKTQLLRTQLNSAIADKPAQIQLKIMEADRELEQRTGQYIKNSPTPHGVPKKLVNYRQGLAQISQEFFDRANEISKLEVPIQANLKQQQAEEKNLSLPPRPNMGADFKKWPWPQGLLDNQRGFEPITKAFAEKNYLAALILSDMHRADLLKDTSDYYSTWAGLLLLHSSDDSMRRYVFEELTKAKQEALLQKWKQLI